VKILVAGGFGVGKTTLVGSISEIKPLRTEELLTAAGVTEDPSINGKTTTTVALDFGRITLAGVATMLLFGTPGQERFWFMWDALVRGALGAVVLVDPRNLRSSFAAVDFFEQRRIPFVVAANCFDGNQLYSEQQLRNALSLSNPATPVRMVDARDRDSVRAILLSLLDQLIAIASSGDVRS
jgi:hypothetical protein